MGGEVKTSPAEAKQVTERNDGSSHRTKNSTENLEVAERGRQLLTEDQAIFYVLREAPEGPRDFWATI